MFNFPDKIVIFDTEYTAWEGSQERKWSGPNEYREIVQIGAILVETQNFDELDSVTLFVKPVKNPQLSDFFINLTGIRQDNVDRNGTDYAMAQEKFAVWAQGHDLYCFGRDMLVMKENSDLAGIAFPFDTVRFHNLREFFRDYGINTDNYMSSTLVEAFGKKNERSSHDGLNDARNLADALRLLKERL